MPKISVNIRVVGLYFSGKVDLVTADAKKPTVKDILEAAKAQYPLAQPGGLTYVAKNDGPGGAETLYSFSHNVKPGTVSKVTGNPISPGLRDLAENDFGATRSVWQYYVLDNKGKDISGSKIKLPFGAEPDYAIGQDYKIIFRNIVITKAETTPAIGPRDLSAQPNYQA